jgi:isopropylmalate/homocitrate/citramalate synthase
MQTIRLTISDETLRDGEQQAGLFFDSETKRSLAHLIAQTGVHQIAIMPAIHETEEFLVKTLVAEGLGNKVVASTMMSRRFIEQSKACGVEKIILFHAVSDRLLLLRDPEIRRHPSYQGKTIDDGIPKPVLDKIRQNMMHKVLKHLRYATEMGLEVYFAAEDASRADFDFLVECICVFQPYIEHFLLCDTVGVLTPEKAYIWIHDLLQYSDRAPLAVHFHNDLGLALENTIQAVLAGVSGISGTFGGIGERSGNVALEQVLNGLRLRFGLEVEGIDYDALNRVTDYLDRLGIRPHPPYSPQAQRHETGVHVKSLLEDRQSYSIFPYGKPEIWFGKCSGASNFQYLFEQHLKRPLTKEQYERLRVTIKHLSIQEKRSFSTEEVLELFERGILKF